MDAQETKVDSVLIRIALTEERSEEYPDLEFWDGVIDRVGFRVATQMGVPVTTSLDDQSWEDELTIRQDGEYDHELQEEASDFIRSVIEESIFEIAYEWDV